MEEDHHHHHHSQELRFVCKLCNKKYPCGKSLGGHMRSHVVANSAESEGNHKTDPPNNHNSHNLSSFSSDPFGINGQSNSSYGLRENPRKTWRAVDSSPFPFPQDRVCKQCGKGFHSLKALCGHMASHSDRDKPFKDDHSWTTSENHKQLVFDSHSDTEEAAEEPMLRSRSLSKPAKRYKKILIKSSCITLRQPPNGSSSVSEIDGEEQEEVAMCLMLLSRDSGNNKGGVNSVESSDNNSVILETKSSSIHKNIHDQGKFGDGIGKASAEMENSDSGYFLDECGKAESDVSVDGFRRYGLCNDQKKTVMRDEDCSGEFRNRNRSKSKSYREKESTMERSEYYNGFDRISRIVRSDSPNAEVYGGASYKRSKYECFNCKKSFKSYQALGGHRPCHKRSNAYESRCNSGNNSHDDSTEFVATGKFVESASNRKSSGKKNKGHVCPFCNRIFKNGQALGGHKRSHFIRNNPIPAKPDLLDLNLPAPEEEDDNNGHNQFSRW